MTRYIDANRLISKIHELYVQPNIELWQVLKCVGNSPTADVVPKSEVEALEREIARLKKSTLPSYCQAISEEEAIKIGKQYGRAEVAREIFEEIERICVGMQDYTDYAELKKKYQEGE